MSSAPQVDPRGRKRAAPGGKYGLSRTKESHTLNMFEVDGELLRDAVAHAVNEGDALLFAMTRDGSALKVQVLSEGGSEETYVGTTESLEDALRTIRDVQP